MGRTRQLECVGIADLFLHLLRLCLSQRDKPLMVSVEIRGLRTDGAVEGGQGDGRSAVCDR